MRTMEQLTPRVVNDEFTAWIRATAARQNLSQADVAYRCPWFVHPNVVAAWFQGKSRPNYHGLVALCVALGELPPALSELCPDAPS